jgi:hypothetical protein
MARFARDCRDTMIKLTRELEKTLGPVSSQALPARAFATFRIRTGSLTFDFLIFRQGTADLTLRFGLNSGPTTAGVLRGEKSRFQLFGDVSSSLIVFSFRFAQP